MYSSLNILATSFWRTTRYISHPRRFSRLTYSHSPNMPSITTDQWLEAAAYRRSVRALGGTSKVSDERVHDIVAKVLSFAPSSYNTQPVRISLAFGKKHEELWSIILRESEPILKSINPGLWQKLGPLFEGHKAAYGSVCYHFVTCHSDHLTCAGTLLGAR